MEAPRAGEIKPRKAGDTVHLPLQVCRAPPNPRQLRPLPHIAAQGTGMGPTN